MAGQVSIVSIAFMVVSLLVSIAIPVVLFVYFRKKKRADILPFFIGCAVMVLFAFVLEGGLNFAISRSALGDRLTQNVWALAIYGGLMAGLFEETGRFLAFRTILKKYQYKDENALMYGAGHGGIEALAILGIASINNIIYSLLINTGHTSILTGPLSGDLLEQVEEAIQTLITTPSYQFLLGGLERILAVAMQISLSVLVWFAVKKKERRYLYPVAILLHCLIDAIVVLMSQGGVSPLLIEGVLAAETVVVAVFAWKTVLLTSRRIFQSPSA